MLNPPLTDQLAQQRTAELNAAAHRQRLARRVARLSPTRVYAGRTLIALGMRLAPAETLATNRVTQPAGR